MIETYLDWKIHRRLDEARTVYICPARGVGKLYREHLWYKELLDQGKKVIFTRPTIYGRAPVKRGYSFEPVLTDRDILTPERWEYIDKLMRNTFKLYADPNLD